jgi:lysozyme
MRWASVLLPVFLLIINEASAEDFPSDLAHVTSRAQEEVLDGQSLGAAAQGSARLLMPLAIDLIKDFEKWKANPYNDASRYCTIGYGHLIAKTACANLAAELTQFTPPLAMTAGLKLLDEDTKIARLAVQSLVHVPLSDEQFGALSSFVFNVGSQSFAGSKMVKFLNNSEYEAALKEFPKWVKSKNQILDGLITRRACESALFKGDLPANKAFNRDDCGSLGAAPRVEDLIDIDVGEKQ